VSKTINSLIYNEQTICGDLTKTIAFSNCAERKVSCFIFRLFTCDSCVGLNDLQ